MPVHNSDIAATFEEVGDLLEIEGENQFRVRSYREAARTISGHSGSVAGMVEEGEDLTTFYGVGEDLAAKIEEIVHTGTLSQLQDLRKHSIPELREVLKVPGLGPERVRQLREEMGIRNLGELEEAAREGELQRLSGFGEKMEANILAEIERSKSEEKRTLLSEAEGPAASLEEYLGGLDEVESVVVAGSYRRRKETVGDLDVVVSSRDGGKIIEAFVAYEDIEEVESKGETRSSVVLDSGLEVDLRVVDPEHFGATLLYFTGSRPHTLALRNLSLEKGLSLNEYGIFKGEEENLGGESEKRIYKELGLAYIKPELRENRGEIEAARREELPDLLTEQDLRGNLHTHTEYTDGRNSLEKMAEAAKKRGYQYLAVTDHSKRLTVTGGLDEKRLRGQMEEIDALNERLEGFILLKGIEADILEDGSLDLADKILEELDVVVCSVHHRLRLPEKEQTDRVVKALENPYTDILAHPTGRQLGQRPPYELDMERVVEAARGENGCFLEINASPKRLDLDDVHARMAKEAGVKIAISTDAHSTDELDNMAFGVGQGRRGWLEAGDVINTRSLEELKSLLSKS